MKQAKRIFITDCEGPITKNDNAFELVSHFIPEGEKFFTQISRYDDVLADIVRRESYKAGDTLKLVVPFLKAYGVNNKKMSNFSSQNTSIIPNARDLLQFVKAGMPSFIVSTSYEHYIRALCSVLRFPFENTYCTRLNIDAYPLSTGEREELMQFRREICEMPLLEIPEEATSLQAFSEKERQTIGRLDEIFWERVHQMKAGAMLREVNPIGGFEKANSVTDVVKKTRTDLSDVMYVGDSITDVQCFRLVKDGGGLTVSFNGNAYAVRAASIALLSNNALVVAIIADVFNRLGIDAVFHLISNWKYEALEKFEVSPNLQTKLRTVFTDELPRASEITASNMKELSRESGAFRKLVRGEKVGKLG